MKAKYLLVLLFYTGVFCLDCQWPELPLTQIPYQVYDTYQILENEECLESLRIHTGQEQQEILEEYRFMRDKQLSLFRCGEDWKTAWELKKTENGGKSETGLIALTTFSTGPDSAGPVTRLLTHPEEGKVANSSLHSRNSKVTALWQEYRETGDFILIYSEFDPASDRRHRVEISGIAPGNLYWDLALCTSAGQTALAWIDESGDSIHFTLFDPVSGVLAQPGPAEVISAEELTHVPKGFRNLSLAPAGDNWALCWQSEYTTGSAFNYQIHLLIIGDDGLSPASHIYTAGDKTGEGPWTGPGAWM